MHVMRQDRDATVFASGAAGPVVRTSDATAPSGMAEQLRRTLELEHIHVALLVESGEADAKVRILTSTWPADMRERGLADGWHGGILAAAARRARSGFLTPLELTQAAADAFPLLPGLIAARTCPHWLFAVPRRSGLSGEIWLGRTLPLSAAEQSIVGASALPLMRTLSQRFARASGKPRRLTPREIECLRFASEGRTSTEIAALLDIAPTTVETHFKHAASKLAANNRPHAVAEALRYGMIA